MAYHCLAADPNLRFQSAGQVLTFLEEWLSNKQPKTVVVEPTASEPGFLIGKYPVTNAEYRRFCAEKDYALPPYLWERTHQDDEQQTLLARRLSGPWLPVTCVSLDDAEKYCDWLSEQTGMTWRLPTEAEWVRAAGGGVAGPYPWGEAVPDRGLSNWDRYYRGPTVVGAFSQGQGEATPCDMAGNVWEWCTDMVADGAPRRVIKGGAYDYSAESLQVIRRDAKVVTCRSPHIGFRALCEESQ
jgi:formylglycine-generating enzyme required for sulfatase activity